MATGSELSVQYEQGELTQWRDPETVLAEATAAAKALGRVIALKKDPVIFNNEQYLEYEDWATCAKFYGLTAKVLETRHVEYGGVAGWEAVAVAINQQGIEVSRAESMCMTDEKNWGAVPVYEWKDRLDASGKKIWNASLRKGKGGYEADRVKVGEEAKPTFQLRSMAQTRACAKALRQVLSWVVVLAGFKPNVAEEMIEDQLGPGDEEKPEKKPVQQPTRASEKKVEAEKAQADAQEISGVIEEAKVGQNGTLWVRTADHLIAVDKTSICDEMVKGSKITVKAKKHNHEKIGDYWAVSAVVSCTLGDIQEGEIVEDGPAEDTGDDPTTKDYGFGVKADTAKAAVAESPALKDLVASGAVKTASSIPETTMSKKENAWKAHVGHDPAVHISVKQDALIYRIQTGRQLTDEVVKGLILEQFGVGHRYHITKEDFPALLDMIDPDFQYHEKKG